MVHQSEKGDIMIEKIDIQGDKMYTITKDAKVNSMSLTESNVNYVKSQNKIEHYQNFMKKNAMLQQECMTSETLHKKKKWIGRLIAILTTIAFLALIIGFAPLAPLVSNAALATWVVTFIGGFTIGHHYQKLQQECIDESTILDEINMELQSRIAKEKRNLNLYALDVRNDKKEFKSKEEQHHYEDSVNYQLKEQYQQLRQELIALCQEKEQEYYQEENKVYHL